MERFGSAFRFLVLSTAIYISSLPACAGFWSAGYYPGWTQAGMPASNIDFTVLTDVIHFSVVPNSDGSLDSSANSLTTANSADIVTRAHAAGKKVLLCVGGASSQTLFQGATTNANLSTFVNNLTNFLASRGYDGIDIDWEPLNASDAGEYTNFVKTLRAALNAFPTHKLLTAAAGAYPPYGDPPNSEYAMYNMIQNQFDQINIMTYDMSGPYDGWVTWFNSPLYDGGYRFPSSGGLVPSVEAAVDNFITNGVAAAKLGIGIAFYGYIWTGGTGNVAGGVTQPRQSWVTAPTATAYSYTDIMADYYQTNSYHWDTSAQAAYLSITNATAANDMFISYDDQRTCQAKVSYARNRGLGGIMIWELSQDHQANQPDPLLEAVGQSLASPGSLSVQKAGNNLNLSFMGIALGQYAIQWTSNLAAGNWNVLASTNVAGFGGLQQISDSGSVTNQSVRFYRIKTPP
jgi:chitinase